MVNNRNIRMTVRVNPKEKEQELKKELIYQREFAEYRIQLAAIKRTSENGVKVNTDWNEANEKLKGE